MENERGYEFMHIDKIKSITAMDKLYRHTYEREKVRNANPELADQNDYIVDLGKTTQGEAYRKRMLELGYNPKELGYKKSDPEYRNSGKHIRSNGVLGYEVLFEVPRTELKNIDIEQQKKDNYDWLNEHLNSDPEKYGNNILSFVYHGDEGAEKDEEGNIINDHGNVHIHAYVIPVDNKGNLNASFYNENPEKLRGLQDSYGDLMESKYGLKRGEKYSTMSHKSLRRSYYAKIDESLKKELPPIAPNETAYEYRIRANEKYKDIHLKAFEQEEAYKREHNLRKMEVKRVVNEVKKEDYDDNVREREILSEITEKFGSVEKCVSLADEMKSMETDLSEMSNEEFVRYMLELKERAERIKKEEKDKSISEYSLR